MRIVQNAVLLNYGWTLFKNSAPALSLADENNRVLSKNINVSRIFIPFYFNIAVTFVCCSSELYISLCKPSKYIEKQEMMYDKYNWCKKVYFVDALPTALRTNGEFFLSIIRHFLFFPVRRALRRRWRDFRFFSVSSVVGNHA